MAAPVALVYDVHGNLPALDAVLADATAAGAGAIVFGGDAAAFGAWPAETVARLASPGLPVVGLRGNWDRWLATHPADDLPDNPVVAGAAAFALARLDPADVARLGALPAAVVVGTTRCVHAAPDDDMAGLSSDAPTGAAADAEAALLAGVAEPRLVTGHTHVQFVRGGRAGDREIEIVNPGSVGLPLDGDTRAAYAILHDDRVELRRVGYDVDASAAALRATGEPWADVLAVRLERASL